MITQSQIKFVRSLHQKKFRDENRQFIAEGPKIIGELLHSELPVVSLFARKEWIEKNQEIAAGEKYSLTEVNEKELSRISNLTNPNQVLAVLNIPEQMNLSDDHLSGTCLALDFISDPGNFGTIIRTADWFGIKTIICSENCVELYNPKVIQATMGSFTRVKVFYSELENLFQTLKGKTKIYGTYTKGVELSKTEKNRNSLIIIGNESKGISPSLEEYIDVKVAIPSQNNSGGNYAESLNASIAAALMCYEFTK
jgi:RNA methyltransferase, TrmH family